MRRRSLAIIPAFDEAKSIGDIIQRTNKYVDQVLVVDDHSNDNTARMAGLKGAIVIRHTRNRGVGAAMKTGIAYARRLGADIIVTIDADGQHKPEDIPRLIQPLSSGEADIVLGSRFLDGQSIFVSEIKRVGNKILTSITSFLAGVELTDTQTGFRAFNRKVLLSLDLVSDFTYTQEMILVLCHKGFRCMEVPVRTLSRQYGKSRVVSRTALYALRTLKIIFSTYFKLKIGW